MKIETFTGALKFRDGYFSSSKLSNVSYPIQGNSDSYLLEEQSFWFQHRNDVISRVVNSKSPNGIIFDIGGGNGFVSKRLQDEGCVSVVLEPGYNGVLNSLERGVKNVIHSSFENADFNNNSIPASGLFDVLEHVDNDVSFLSEINKKTSKNGFIYITVPAYKFLWSYEDDYGGHFRRYTILNLKSVMQDAGFSIEYMSYFFTFLPLPIFLFRTLPTSFGLRKKFEMKTVETEHKSSVISSLYVKLSQFELDYMSKGIKIPLGASIIAVGRKS